MGEDEGQQKSLHINKEELKDNSKKTSRGKVAEYKMKGSDEKKTGKIMSAQPKSTGKYSHWLNIELEAENEKSICINWDHVDQWRELPQVTEEVSDQEHVFLHPSEQKQAKEVIDAKKREIENMEIHWVYESVPDIGQKCISTRWVITEKFKDKKKIMKAYRVAHGYEEDSHNMKTDSPICSHEAMHIVMLTTSVMKWRAES